MIPPFDVDSTLTPADPAAAAPAGKAVQATRTRVLTNSAISRARAQLSPTIDAVNGTTGACVSRELRCRANAAVRVSSTLRVAEQEMPIERSTAENGELARPRDQVAVTMELGHSHCQVSELIELTQTHFLTSGIFQTAKVTQTRRFISTALFTAEGLMPATFGC
jgi:flagellar motor switch/type III secretory pathway protein FliN